MLSFDKITCFVVAITWTISAVSAWELEPHGTVPSAPILPLAGRTIVRVSTVTELANAAWNVVSDTTILIAPGTYNLNDGPSLNGLDRRITLGKWGATPVQRVEFRGETGDPNDVILQGPGRDDSSLPSCIHIFSAQDLLISGMTIKTCCFHNIHVDANQGAREIKMHSLILTESGQQMVKFSGNGAHDSSIEYSHISSGGIGHLKHPGFGNQCYVNGIDVNGRHNNFSIEKVTIEDYRCADGSVPGPAILMWNGVKDTVIDSVAMVGITRGISLGLVTRSGYFDHEGGSVTNCMITQDPANSGNDVAIFIVSPNTYVAHNTILTRGVYKYDGTNPTAIETRFSTTTGVLIHANFMDGNVNRRNGSQATEQNTAIITSETWFVDSFVGDLRLTPQGESAVPQVARQVSTDFDGQLRSDPTTVGASDTSSTPTTPTTTPPTEPPATAAPTSTPQGQCASGVYYTKVVGSMNYASAEANAPDGCVLSPIRTLDDVNAAKIEAGGTNECWVGVATDITVSGTASYDGWYNLVDDSAVPALSSFWRDGEPNNSGGGNAQTRATINRGGGNLRDVAPVDTFNCAVYTCCDSMGSSTTDAPTDAPTLEPTDAPTTAPTIALTDSPTVEPTDDPTMAPTIALTDSPTAEPTDEPTTAPTTALTDSPTAQPTDEPTTPPTTIPSPPTPTTNCSPGLVKVTLVIDSIPVAYCCDAADSHVSENEFDFNFDNCATATTYIRRAI